MGLCQIHVVSIQAKGILGVKTQGPMPCKSLIRIGHGDLLGFVMTGVCECLLDSLVRKLCAVSPQAVASTNIDATSLRWL